MVSALSPRWQTQLNGRGLRTIRSGPGRQGTNAASAGNCANSANSGRIVPRPHAQSSAASAAASAVSPGGWSARESLSLAVGAASASA